MLTNAMVSTQYRRPASRGKCRYSLRIAPSGVDMLKMKMALRMSRLCNRRPMSSVHSPNEAG